MACAHETKHLDLTAIGLNGNVVADCRFCGARGIRVRFCDFLDDHDPLVSDIFLAVPDDSEFPDPGQD